MVKGRVMVVDDDKEFLEELTQTLQLGGYEVVSVPDSTKAGKIANNTKPDVILLDLKMHRMSGFEVAEELKKFADTVMIPIIGMTGVFIEEEHVPLMEICGIKRCIKKPFNPLDVIAAIETALNG